MPRAKNSTPAKPARKKAQTAKSRVQSTASADADGTPNKKRAQAVTSRERSTASAGANSKPTKKGAQPSLEDEVQAVITSLKRIATQATLEGMARYAIASDKAFGVSMTNMNLLAKRLGRNHELANTLWETGWYEARMLASLIDEPARVTPAQMDRWCRDFDNWAIVDTVCFKLFDQTAYAWRKVAQWCDRPDEWVKRAGFALLWSLTVHDKLAGDEPFLQGLVFIERAADDERHFVKKAVNMALRAVGKRNLALNAAAASVARRLAESPNAAARWVGKDAPGAYESRSDAAPRIATPSRGGMNDAPPQHGGDIRRSGPSKSPSRCRRDRGVATLRASTPRLTSIRRLSKHELLLLREDNLCSP